MTLKMAHNFFYSVAQGLIPNVHAVAEFGENLDVGTSQETLWGEGGLYSYLSSAEQLTLSSTSANDTSGGTGLQTVTIFGLDGNYDEQSETITLNGLSGVTTTNSYLRIYTMCGVAVGSGGVNAGNIYAGTGTITAGKPANVYAQMDIGKGQTLMAIYTIPAGYTGYLRQIYFSTGKSHSIYAQLYTRKINESLTVKHTGRMFDGLYHKLLDFPIVCTEKTDIEIRVTGEASNSQVSGGFDLMIVKD
jgi:hypothetical protein